LSIKANNEANSINLLHLSLFTALAAIFLFLTTGSIAHKTLTYDEPQHYRYGEQILDFNSDRFDDSKMPFSVLNALASKLADRVLGDRLTDPWQIMGTGRTATIFFSLAVAFLVYIWAKELYGKWVGLIAMALYVFEPNIIAHSRLITTDIYATGTITLALFLFWRFLEKPGLRRGIYAALSLGLCQLAKYTGLFLYPLFLILVIFYYWKWIWHKIQTRSFGILFQAFLSFIKYAFLFLLISLVIINIGFLFNHPGTLLGQYQFKSMQFQKIQSLSPLLQKIPLPVPYPYIDGLDQVLFNERTAESYGSIYLLGELKKSEGFPGYFFIASFYKVPIPILILFSISLINFILTVIKEGIKKEDLLIVVPAIYFAIYFNYFFRAQIGIRFFLVIFPILLIFSASIFRKWCTFSKMTRGFFIFLGMYLVISVASYFPHYLSYFNEFVPNRNLAYQKLADSNLDWGQDGADLKNFLENNPETIFEPAQPTNGLIIVGVNELTGVSESPKNFKWLRDNFLPIDNLNYSYLIYDISPSDIEKVQINNE
jgi:hypothetical protein